MLFFILSILGSREEQRTEYVATVHDHGTRSSGQDLVNLRETILDDVRRLKRDMKELMEKELDELKECFKYLESGVTEIKAALKRIENSINSKADGYRGFHHVENGRNRNVRPYPGNSTDYNFLFEIITKLRHCGECCTCIKGDICLSAVYAELLTLLGKYPDWNPAHGFGPKRDFSGENNPGTMLELVIRILKKERCDYCAICNSIDNHPKLSFLFGPNLLDLFYTGDIKDDALKRMLLSFSGGMGSTFGGMSDMMPGMFLAMMNKNKKKECGREVSREDRRCIFRRNDCIERKERPKEMEERPVYGRRPSPERREERPAYGKNYGNF